MNLSIVDDTVNIHEMALYSFQICWLFKYMFHWYWKHATGQNNTTNNCYDYGQS